MLLLTTSTESWKTTDALEDAGDAGDEDWESSAGEREGSLETQALMLVPSGRYNGGIATSQHHYRHHYLTQRYVRHRYTFHVQLQTIGASLKGKLGSIVGVLINRARRTGGRGVLLPAPTIPHTTIGDTNL